ncbi:MAG: PIN domain-containing protein [Pirellulaceae bacterium]|nr:PIN domain-containing protein [Pirellulaceae bacterium]
MILVDTSVVIAYLRTADPRLLSMFASQQAAICRITRAEVLHGVRSPTERVRWIAALDSFQQQAIPESLWDEVGDCLAALRAAGLPMPLADVIVAALAIHLDVELWSRDAHHPLMQSCSARSQAVY